MQTDQFYQSRQADWQALDELSADAQKSLRTLSPEEVSRLGALYRAVTSDLALAQRDFPHHRVTEYLNQLVARAHAVVYRSEPLAQRRIVEFVKVTYPRLYRQMFPFIGTAMLLFIVPALIAGILTSWQPESARWLLPEQLHRLIATIEQRDTWTDIPVEERPYSATFIMRNNIQVAILAFGGGVLAGVLSVWALIFNGLILGGLTGLTAHYGVGFELWTFVIGHGVIELSVIFIAGGLGLRLGWAVIHPGLFSRRDALAQAANQAVSLFAGSLPLLVVAGLIEGFLSPAESIAWPIKWGVGLVSGLALYTYLGLAGRERPV